jgi:parvulin-like peptidyl-prolyl isomerase
MRISDLTANRSWKHGAIIAGLAVLAIIIIVVALFGVLVYVYASDNPAVKVAADIIPYPAEQVNGHFARYSDYLFQLNLNERAYQYNSKLNNQPAVDYTSAKGKKLLAQMKKQSLNTVELESVVAQLAQQQHVTLSNKDVNNLLNQFYQRYGGQATLLKMLNQVYGWNLSDLKKVIRQQLLQQDVQTAVTNGPAAAAAKAKAEDVLSKFKSGSAFATLAKQDSQASDAANGGDMGNITKTQVPADVWTAVSALQPGQTSDVVKVSGGYAIYTVVAKNADGSIHTQEILVKTIDFNTYMQGQLKKAKVHVYIKQ